MYTILTNVNSVLRKTANIMAEELGQKWRVVTKLSDGVPPTVRWGTSKSWFQKDTDLNSPYCINTAGVKTKLAEVLRNAGISHVEFFNDTPTRYPVVVRKMINVGGGRGIVIVKNESEFQQYIGNTFSYWYDFQFELGVHVLDGRIARVFKKVWPEELTPQEFPIRNTQLGWEYRLRNIEKYKKLPQFVSGIYSVFPIRMCRMDIGWDDTNKTYRLIEINSAPDLSNNSNTRELYTNFIKEVVNAITN
jgi:hypothetical protein